MLNRNKQATKICFSKPQKLYFGEEVSSSPDKSENTVSIFLLRLNQTSKAQKSKKSRTRTTFWSPVILLAYSKFNSIAYLQKTSLVLPVGPLHLQSMKKRHKLFFAKMKTESPFTCCSDVQQLQNFARVNLRSLKTTLKHSAKQHLR